MTGSAHFLRYRHVQVQPAVGTADVTVATGSGGESFCCVQGIHAATLRTARVTTGGRLGVGLVRPVGSHASWAAPSAALAARVPGGGISSTTIDLEVGVLLIQAVESSGTSGLVSG